MAPYLRLLDWAMNRRWLTLLAGVLFFFASLGLFPFLPVAFVPTTDQAQTTITLELPPGATLAQTESLVAQTSAILKARPEVKSVFATVGGGAVSGDTMSGGDVRRATLVTNLLPKGDRRLSQREFESAIRTELQQVAGARVRVGADFGPSNSNVSVTLGGDDPVALEQAALRLEREMRGIPGLANPSSTASLLRPELTIRPRLDKAAELGVTVDAIGTTARLATLGDIDANLGKFNLPDRQIPIRVRIDDQGRSDLSVLEDLRVPTATGALVPLKSVASVELSSGPAQINRLDRQRQVTVTAEMNGIQLGTALQQIHALPAMKELPPHVAEMNYGVSERMAELFTGFGIAIFAGLLLVYLVLVLLFGGFIHPLTIMAALPLSLGGALGLLVMAREALSMPAMIGVLMLMGIASKNSILLVEYAIMAMRDHGMDRRSALFDAASKRARPIIMTTVAMGAGMVPIALRMGAEADFRAPMAIAVLGGLITSTLLSLVYIPVAFTFADDMQRWLARKLGRFVSAAEEGIEEKAAPEGAAAPARPRLLAGE
jgi:HAE1 family hydrophobic/amphiphilic exporter-1